MDQKLLAYALQRLNKLELAEAFDADVPGSRPTKPQLQLFKDLGEVHHRYVVAANQSGKSQSGAREVSWLFTESHPFWKRPTHWGDEPLLMIVVGRTSKQVEEVLWRKIKGFLDEDEYQVKQTGGVIQKVVNTKNGNTIIFQSHHSENEAREKLQAYVAHYVWIDEMPGSAKLIEELHRRVQAKKGYFLATFTPKVVNAAIRKLVDTAEAPYAKKYVFKMFDNPVYTKEDKKRILSSLSSFSKSYQATILEGAWAAGDLAVYEFDHEKMIRLPEGYHRSWRHVESVDPATSSKFGYTIFAECPKTGTWYLIRADYIEKVLDPEQMVKECMARSDGLNIVRRVCDPANPWFRQMAIKFGLSYMYPYDKARRKNDLQKNLQTALTEDKLKIAPWCTDFIDEITTCQFRDEDEEQIINSRRYHTLDCAQYFWDCKPKFEGTPVALPWHVELKEGNRARRAKEAAEKKHGRLTLGRVKKRGVWTSGARIKIR